MKPLEGILVLDFSQFLAGPLAALRLADLGARVIKIERPDGGDLCRRLYISNLELDGDSTLFHSINRNKESFAADLKSEADRARVRKLITRADVLITNFRPGVMQRLELDYDRVRQLNPRLVYASITGYGEEGPWSDKPGQDLLAQALSGLMWLSGDGDGPPVPMGLAVADMFAGHFLVQGILACLVRRARTNTGGLVQTSLLEALLDFQFEVLTTHLNDGGQRPRRAARGNAHAYLGAPYGVFQTADSYLAMAMNPLPKLAELLELPDLIAVDRSATFEKRDQINARIAERLLQQPTEHWLALLEPHGIWCAPVLHWPQLLRHEAFKVLRMTQTVCRDGASPLTALRCPLTVDRQLLTSPRGAPRIGEHNQILSREFEL